MSLYLRSFDSRFQKEVSDEPQYTHMEYDIPSGTTFGDLKKRIGEEYNIPAEKLRIIFAGKLMADEWIIDCKFFAKEGYCHLVVRD